MKKFTKCVLSTFVALMMVFSLLPAAAFAAEGDVAKIGDTTYATLKDAVSKSVDGDRIELLGNASLPSTTFPSGKAITIDGNGYTIDANQAHLNVAGNVTFEDCTMNMYGVPQGHWMYIYMASDGVLTFRDATVNIDGTNAAANTTAMYFPEPGTHRADVNIERSAITIKKCDGNGISWGGRPDNGYNQLNITNSTVTIDNCAAQNSGGGGGIIGTFDITVTGSNLTVTNNRSYGSNGSNYYIDDSIVNYSNNGTHGLSAGNLTIRNKSTVNANDNGMYGITYTGVMEMDGTSVVNVYRNALESTGGGLRAANSTTSSTVENGAIMNICDNGRNGLENYGTFTFEDGVTLTITGNDERTTNGGGIFNGSAGQLILPAGAVITGNHAGQTGGGICNAGTITIPEDVKLYNNHAGIAGDDVYNRADATMNLPTVGSDWVLDDCEHLIDGYYQDGENARWKAHVEEGETANIVLFEGTAVSGLTALKAAHGEKAQDKTSYPGLEKKVWDDGKEAWVDGITSADNQSVSFKLTSNVPDDLLNYIEADPAEPPEVETPPAANLLAEERGAYKLVIHDKMDKAFVDPGSFVVTLDREGTDNDVELKDTQYTLTNPGADGCTFDITIDLAALYEAGVVTEADITNATPIVVTYTAILAEGTTAGTYKNTSWVTAPGDWKTAVDEVTVDTYAISIFKYDQSNETTGLEGATFELYQKDGGGSVIESSKVILTSGPDGIAKADGLDEGTYYLKEVDPPEGYVGSDQELTVVIPDKAGTDNIANVKFANSPVPHTGGMGTTLFTVGGAAILAVAGALFVTTRRKAEN